MKKNKIEANTKTITEAITIFSVSFNPFEPVEIIALLINGIIILYSRTINFINNVNNYYTEYT